MLVWVHVLASGLVVGMSVALCLLVIPAARRHLEADVRRRAVTRVLRLVDPILIGLLGVIVMTGAFAVTDMKQRLGPEYFGGFGRHLAIKLTFAFFAVLFGTWLSLGTGHRLVREEDWGDPPDPARLDGALRRLGMASWATALATLAALVVALRPGA